MERFNTNSRILLFPRWVFPLYNFFGLLPLRLSLCGASKFNPKSVLRCFVILVTSIFLATYFQTKKLNNFTESSPSQKVITTFRKYLISLSTGAIGVSTILRSFLKEFDGIHGNLLSFENIMGNKSPKKTANVIHNLCLLNIALPFFLNTAYRVEKLRERNYGMLAGDLGFAVCNVYLDFTSVLFILVVSNIADGFQRLNGIVQLCCNERIFKRNVIVVPLSFSTVNLPKVTIEEVRTMFQLLVDTIHKTNSFFGVQLACIMMVKFIYTVTQPYTLASAMFLQQPDIETITANFYIWKAVWIIVLFSSFLFLVWNASQAAYHARKTAYHVSLLLSKDLAPELQKEVKFTLSQMTNSKIDFTVLGMFPINLQLITSFISISLSYTIVMLQLKATSFPYNKDKYNV